MGVKQTEITRQTPRRTKLDRKTLSKPDKERRTSSRQHGIHFATGMEQRHMIQTNILLISYAVFFRQIGQLFLTNCEGLPQVIDGAARKGKGLRDRESQVRNLKSGGCCSSMSSCEDDDKWVDLVLLVQAGLQNDLSWRDSWKLWCKNADQSDDPSAYRSDPMFIIAFVFHWGLANVCEVPWAKSFLVSLGNVSKNYMVKAVKTGLSIDAEWRDAWTNYANMKANYHDASLHDPGSLFEFFDTIAIVQFQDRAFLQVFLTGRYTTQ